MQHYTHFVAPARESHWGGITRSKLLITNELKFHYPQGIARGRDFLGLDNLELPPSDPTAPGCFCRHHLGRMETNEPPALSTPKKPRPIFAPRPPAKPSAPAAREMLTTRSQQAALATLSYLGELFFLAKAFSPQLQLRLFPLLVGPTGVGKSRLVQQAAAEQGANYFKITRSEWLVVGCRAGRPTVHQILDRLCQHERVLLHLDELDKMQIDFSGSEWSSSIAGDLWNILDGKFQVEEYLREYGFEGDHAAHAVVLREKIARMLWIVGSGTWQSVFEKNRPGTTVGFRQQNDGVGVDAAAIIRAGVIAPELLHRFNGDLIFLSYPSRDETAELLRTTGIAALAQELGVAMRPEDIDWTKGGMRALETIATRLVVAQHRARPQWTDDDNRNCAAITDGPSPQ